MKTSSLSRREKLLLGLLSSTLIFSASFSYGAVNSSKVDAIMQTITNAGNAFTTQTDRDTYYQRVYTGLADAVALLITVQNNVGAMIGTAPVTVPPVGTLPPVNTVNPGQSAAQVLGIFANAPIPAPCPANTIMMKEDLGKPGAGMWLHKTWNNKNPALGTYHVYKLTLKESAATYKEMLKLEPSPRVVFDSAETNGVVGGTNYTHIKISPYPCDFVTQAEIDAAKAQGYGWRGNFGACGHSNLDVTYKIDGVDDPKNIGSCTLKLGGTYYVNVGPSPSLSAASESGYRYTIMNRTSYTDPAGIYGIYPFVKDANGVSTNPQYDAWKEKTNSSGENAETLRQSVVNSYKSQIGSQATGGPGPVSNSSWSSATSISCPTSLAGLQSANPSTISSTNSTGMQYTSVGGVFFNVKNYTNTNDISLPTSCTAGQKWIAKSGANSCSVYSCGNGGAGTSGNLTVTNPIADYPIPPPCPAGVKIMKEFTAGNAQPRMTVFDRVANPSGVVYKVPTNYLRGDSFSVSIGDNSFGIGHVVAHGKISPYPCDFPANDPSIETSGCSVLGGHRQFDISTKEFFWKDPIRCNLKKGQTYYLNIQPSFSEGIGSQTACNSSIGCGVLTEVKSNPSPQDLIWGVYTTWEDYVTNRTKQNSTSENPETLRQKVINDYKTKGVNSDQPIMSGVYQGSSIVNNWTSQTYSNNICTMTAPQPQYATIRTTSLVYKKLPPSSSADGLYYLGGNGMYSYEALLAKASACPSGTSNGSSANVSGNRKNFEGLNVECKVSDTLYMLDYPDACYSLCEEHGGEIDVRGDCIINSSMTSFQ